MKMASAVSLEDWSPLARVYDPLKTGSIDGTDTEPHDRAVVTAMKADYKPNHLVEGEPKSTLFVARLHPDTTEETVEKAFSKYGRVRRVRLIRDVVTGFSKKYAFVEYESEDDARYAFRRAQAIDIDNTQVYVDYEIERTLKGWVPRRMGGGFGGKKESGQLRFGGRDRPFRKPILVTRDMSESVGPDSRGVLRLQGAGGETDRKYQEHKGSDRRYGHTRQRSRSRDRSRRDYKDRMYKDSDRRRDDRDYNRHRDREHRRSRSK